MGFHILLFTGTNIASFITSEKNKNQKRTHFAIFPIYLGYKNGDCQIDASKENKEQEYKKLR